MEPDIFAADWREQSIVVFDTETTSLSPKKERVAEFGAVLFQGGQPVKFFNRLMDPQRKFAPDATKVHGITDEMVKGRALFADHAKAIQSWLSGPAILCAFNEGFDRAFLTMEFDRVGMSFPDKPIIDPLLWARFLWPGMKNDLDSVSDRLRMSVSPDIQDQIGDDSGRHRAAYDAALTGSCLFAMQNIMPKSLRQTLYVQDYLYRWSLTKKPNFKRDIEPTLPPEHIP